MAILYVDGDKGNDNSGNGSSSKPWKTLAKANSNVKSGDTVLVRSAVYHESVNITTANTTWKADAGHTPILDGRYSPSERLPNGNMPSFDAKKSYIPGSMYGKMINIQANNVTVEGFVIRNVAGQPVGILGNNATLRDCTLDFAYGGGINVENVQGMLIENVRMYRCNQKRYDPTNTKGGPANVQVNLLLKRVRNGIIRGCEIAYNHGEGIGLALESRNCIVENCHVHTNLHMHIVINHAQNNIIRNNFVYHSNDPEFVQRKSGDPPTGIVISDENQRREKLGLAHSEGNLIYNNIVVGMGQNFVARYSKNSAGALRKTYVGYNTFVNAYKNNGTAVNVRIPPASDHNNSVFENNIIIQDSGNIAQVPGGNQILFRNNIWSQNPGAAAKGTGDGIGDPKLLNHRGPLEDGFGRAVKANAENYRLTERSVLAIGKAVNGGQANGLPIPKIASDFFNSNRDNKPDIGAHEFNGTTPPSILAASFSIGEDQETGVVPHTVNFADLTNGNIQSWLWNFGDGATSTEQHPSHTYTEPGSYTVSLEVTATTGEKDTIVKEGLITVVLDQVEPPQITGFRRFHLINDDTGHAIACGTQYPDKRCIIVWNEDPYHMLNYDTIKDAMDLHVQEGITSLVWLDPEQ